MEIVYNPDDDSRQISRSQNGKKKLIEQAQNQIHAIERLVRDILEPLRSTDKEFLRPQNSISVAFYAMSSIA